jgi:hypothetical protein
LPFDGQANGQLFCCFQSKIVCFDGQMFYKSEHKNSRAFLPKDVQWTERKCHKKILAKNYYENKNEYE